MLKRLYLLTLILFAGIAGCQPITPPEGYVPPAATVVSDTPAPTESEPAEAPEAGSTASVAVQEPVEEPTGVAGPETVVTEPVATAEAGAATVIPAPATPDTTPSETATPEAEIFETTTPEATAQAPAVTPDATPIAPASAATPPASVGGAVAGAAAQASGAIVPGGPTAPTPTLEPAHSGTGSAAPGGPPPTAEPDRAAHALPDRIAGDALGLAPPPCLALAAGGPPFEIDLDAGWQVGEQRHYTIYTHRQEWSGDSPPLNARGLIPFTVTVRAANRTGFELEWDYGKTRLLEGRDKADFLLDYLTALLPELHLAYETDRYGSFVTLLNGDEVETAVYRGVAMLAALTVDTTDGLVLNDLTIELVNQLIAEPEQVVALLIQELQLFHLLYGILFDTTEPLLFEDLLANPLGGEGIPSQVSIRPTHFDAESGCARIEWLNRWDPEAATASIFGSILPHLEAAGLPGLSLDELPGYLEVADRMIFQFDLASGWPAYIEVERTMRIGDQERIDRRVIVPADGAPVE
jgi:hypothetical protein